MPRESSPHTEQALLEDALLRFGHLRGFGGIVVVPAGEVEEAVDEVEGHFVLEIGSVVGGLTCGGFDADEDFAVVKGDDIRGRRVFQKLAMHARDFGVVDECGLDFRQRGQHALVARFGGGEAKRQRVLHDATEPWQRQCVRFLTVEEADRGFHAVRIEPQAAAGGDFRREVRFLTVA